MDRTHTLYFSRSSLLRGALMMVRRTLEGAPKCALRDFLLEEAMPAAGIVSFMAVGCVAVVESSVLWLILVIAEVMGGVVVGRVPGRRLVASAIFGVRKWRLATRPVGGGLMFFRSVPSKRRFAPPFAAQHSRHWKPTRRPSTHSTQDPCDNSIPNASSPVSTRTPTTSTQLRSLLSPPRPENLRAATRFGTNPRSMIHLS